MKITAVALTTALLIPTTTLAETGPLRTLALGQDLFAYGLAQEDPVMVLSAAKITGSVFIEDVARNTQTRPGATPGSDDSTPADPAVTTAAQMYQIAYDLAEGDDYLQGLIEDASVEGSRGRVGGATRTLNRLQAGYVDMVRLEFEGGILAELAILGNDGSNLDLKVIDEKGKTICQEQGASDKLYCAWTPTQDGVFFAEVENVSSKRKSYYVLTN